MRQYRGSRLARAQSVLNVTIRWCSVSGKILYERDLLVGERADFLAIDADDADDLLVLKHRYVNSRSRAAENGRHIGDCCGSKVRGVTHLLGQHHMFEPCTRSGPKHASLPL